MPRIFAIGDIHGCYKTFQKLLLEKIGLQRSDQIYCIGDYIDRGKRSREVVDLIIRLREQGYHIHTLRGNHEQLMLDSGEGDGFDLWMANGGMATLKSFKVSSFDQLESKYHEFFTGTKFYIRAGGYIFVHAGLNFDYDDPFEDKLAMLWIRDSVIDIKKLDNQIIVHGHTPQPLEFILSQSLEHSINIDGGCVYKHNKEYGYLVAFDVEEQKFIAVKNAD